MYMIVSAYRPENHYVVNVARTAELIEHVEEVGLPWRLATGCFNGVLEESLIVHVPDAVRSMGYALANHVMSEFQQEAALLVEESDASWLLHADGTTDFLGRMVKATKQQAEAMGNYTQVGDAYYVTG